MDYNELLKEVNVQVNEQLPEHLIPALVSQHRHYRFWRSCPCEYCSLKREATIVIANLGTGMPEEQNEINDELYRLDKNQVISIDLLDEVEYKGVVRTILRQKYRKLLKQLVYFPGHKNCP